MFKRKPVYAHISLKAQNKCLLLVFCSWKNTHSDFFFSSPTLSGYTVHPFAAVT